MKYSTTEAQIFLFDPQTAIVADFDDTLAQTSSFHVRSITETVKQLTGRELVIDASLKSKLKGKTTQEIFKITFAHLQLNVDQAAIQEAMRLSWEISVQLTQQTPLEPLLKTGAAELIRKMRASGKQGAIATNSSEAFVTAFLANCQVDACQIIDDFPWVVGQESMAKAETQLGRRLSKPNPYHVRLAAAQIPNSTAKNIMYLGDSEVDLQTLRNDSSLMGIIINALNCEQYGQEHGEENIIFLSNLQHLFEG